MALTEQRLLQIIKEEVLHHQEQKINEAMAGLVLEGIYDPGILKAVFMAGGPGSGKSKTAEIIFGGGAIEKAAFQAGTTTGLRVINSDPAFEEFLRQAGISPSDLKDMTDEEFEAITDPPDSPRGRAKKLKSTAQRAAGIGRIGMIVDGTGQDFKKMSAKKEAAETLGYDTYMVFVNTTLEKSQERNLNRDRKLKPETVEEIWTNVQANMGAYQSLFGVGNFIIIDNTEYTWDDAASSAAAAAQAFIDAPVQNPIGRQWVEEAITAKGADPDDPWVAKKISALLDTPASRQA